MWWFLRRSLVRRTIMVCMTSAGVLCGLAAAQTNFVNHSAAWLLASLFLLLTIFIRSRLSLALVLIGGAMLGIWRGSDTAQQIAVLQSQIGQKIIISGRISEDISTDNHGQKIIYIDNLKLKNQKLAGRVRLSTNSAKNLERGDVIMAAGKLADGFGNYQASVYQAELKLLQKNNDPWLKLRNQFAAGTRTAMTEPAASLGLGFVIGEQSSLPSDLSDALKYAGLMHIVVASGYNLTILVRVARRLFAKVSKYQALVASLGLTFAFSFITGFSPSMSRAALVTSLSILAWYYGRRIHPLVLLFFAAAVTGLINPLYVWSDMGWYLSFLAFAGVLILAPLLTKRILKNKTPPLLVQVAIESIAAQILTLPLLVGAFGYVSFVSLLANVLIVPLVPVAMLLTFISGLFGMVIPAMAPFFGAFADSLINVMIWVIEKIAAWPWAYREISLQPWLTYTLYSFIITVIIILWRKTKHRFNDSALTD